MMNRSWLVIIIVVLVVSSVLLLYYGLWKTNAQWDAAYECRCGNGDALFSSRDEYFQSQIASTLLVTMPIAVGLIFLVVVRPLGALILVIMAVIRLFTLIPNLDARDAYAQLERGTALFELVAIGVLSLIVVFLDDKRTS
jgi:hypothetical protein